VSMPAVQQLEQVRAKRVGLRSHRSPQLTLDSDSSGRYQGGNHPGGGLP
jgi:hypothetical protein